MNGKWRSKARKRFVAQVFLLFTRAYAPNENLRATVTSARIDQENEILAIHG